MAIIQVEPGMLRATERIELNMQRVHQFYILGRNQLPIEPLTVIEDQSSNRMYLVNGHHRAYAEALLGRKQVRAELLRTDYDVKECKRGKSRSYETHAALLDACKEDHVSSQASLGIEFILDYTVHQPKPSTWDYQPIIQIVSLNPSIDVYTPENRVPGGKGMILARNLVQLGYDNVCIYALAGGRNGKLLARMINSQHIPFYFTSILDETAQSTIGPQNFKKRPLEDNPEVRFNELQDIKEKIEQAVHETDIAVVAGSIPKNARPSIHQEMLRESRKKGATTVFETSEQEPLRLALDAPPHILRIGREELTTYLGKGSLTLGELASETAALRTRTGIETILVSLENGGMLAVTNEGRFYTEPFDGEVKCNIGAGDALLAGYLKARALHYQHEESITDAVGAVLSHLSHPGNQGALRQEADKLKEKVEVQRLS